MTQVRSLSRYPFDGLLTVEQNELINRSRFATQQSQKRRGGVVARDIAGGGTGLIGVDIKRVKPCSPMVVASGVASADEWITRG